MHGSVRVATTLEETWGNDPVHLDELAYHFVAGATADERSKAISYACRAGESAYRSYAYERAAAHGRPALALLEQEGPNSRRVAEPLRKLGETYSTTDFDQPKALECLERAATLFEVLSDYQEAAQVPIARQDPRRGPVMHIGEAMAQYRRAEPLPRRRAASEAQALLYVGIASGRDSGRAHSGRAQGFDASDADLPQTRQ